MQEQLLAEILSELRQINTHLASLPHLLAQPFQVEIVDRAMQRQIQEYVDYFKYLAGLRTPKQTTSIQPATESAAPPAVETTPPLAGDE